MRFLPCSRKAPGLSGVQGSPAGLCEHRGQGTGLALPLRTHGTAGQIHLGVALAQCHSSPADFFRDRGAVCTIVGGQFFSPPPSLQWGKLPYASKSRLFIYKIKIRQCLVKGLQGGLQHHGKAGSFQGSICQSSYADEFQMGKKEQKINMDLETNEVKNKERKKYGSRQTHTHSHHTKINM